MADSRMRFKVGSIEFEGEGDSKWLETQLNIVLKAIPQLAKVSPVTDTGGGGQGGQGGNENGSGEDPGALATYLKKHKATKTQNMKFLATAQWLHLKGQARVATKDVTKALSTAQQNRLSNASQCLNNLVQQGFCVKEGKEFYVTDEGRASIGGPVQ